MEFGRWVGVDVVDWNYSYFHVIKWKWKLKMSSVKWGPFCYSLNLFRLLMQLMDFSVRTGTCFTKVLLDLQNNLMKIHNAGNLIYGENFKLKLCTCAQSMALATRTKFHLEILSRSMISAIYKFRKNISWRAHEMLIKQTPTPTHPTPPYPTPTPTPTTQAHTPLEGM